MEVEKTLLSDTLQTHVQPITPNDTLAEAGKKELLHNLVQMLQHETGSLTGEDIEDVHQMRVATRRMRSIFKLLQDQYKSKAIKPFAAQLKIIAGHLGAIRDLDVMIDNLQKLRETLPGDDQTAVDTIVQKLDKKRQKARKRFAELVESKAYGRFVREFTEFLTHEGRGIVSAEDGIEPNEVRHIAPVILHQHLANVRAYDNYIEDAPVELLHQLRIEFKRLRYAVTFFKDVLGKSIEGFIEELKTMQDHLGRLNDIVVAQDTLTSLKNLDEAEIAVIDAYLAQLEAEANATMANYNEVWQHFNVRTVQRKLTDSLLILR